MHWGTLSPPPPPVGVGVVGGIFQYNSEGASPEQGETSIHNVAAVSARGPVTTGPSVRCGMVGAVVWKLGWEVRSEKLRDRPAQRARNRYYEDRRLRPRRVSGSKVLARTCVVGCGRGGTGGPPKDHIGERGITEKVGQVFGRRRTNV